MMYLLLTYTSETICRHFGLSECCIYKDIRYLTDCHPNRLFVLEINHFNKTQSFQNTLIQLAQQIQISAITIQNEIKIKKFLMIVLNS